MIAHESRQALRGWVTPIDSMVTTVTIWVNSGSFSLIIQSL